MTAYNPLCPLCRVNSPTSFFAHCQGCLARRARIAAEHNKLTPAQVAGMDSTFQPLPETSND